MQSTTRSTQIGTHDVISPATTNYYTTRSNKAPAAAASAQDLMVMRQNRHQRDLFTGSLGIPDVNTHVGSVIHAFESLANQRADQLLIGDSAAFHAEQPYETTTNNNNFSSFINGRTVRIRQELVDDDDDDDLAGMVGNRHTLPSFHHFDSPPTTAYAPQYKYLPNEYPAAEPAGKDPNGYV